MPLALLIALIVVAGAPALEAAGNGRIGYGYVFAAPGFTVYESGQTPATQNVGGGGELRVRGDMALGAEAAYLHIGAGKYSREYSMGVISWNISHHWGARTPGKKLMPFVTAGYSQIFDQTGSGPALNLGIGVHYWFRPRFGVRLEVRNTTANASAMCFRIGLAFR